MAERVSQPPKRTFGPSYARLRKETDFDILTTAIKLKRAVAKYVMNEARVPKRWRYAEGLPALAYAREVRDKVSAANDVPLTKETLAERRALQYGALAACNKLQMQLADIVEECSGATPESLRPIVDLILPLTQRIPKWIRSDSDRA